MARTILRQAIGVLVAFALAMSAYRHLDNPFQFLAVVHSYQLVGESLGFVLAWLLPPLQLVVAFTILFDAKGRQAAFEFAAVLFLLFVLAQMSVAFRGPGGSGGSIGLALGGLALSLAGARLSRPRPAAAPG